MPQSDFISHLAAQRAGARRRHGDATARFARRHRLDRHLQAPFGVIIVTGPTGSGKTTTLAASLAVINEPARKILTIEDPVEYHIRGINQTQVDPAIGLIFATVSLLLAKDPDLIMVGAADGVSIVQIPRF